jgi:hypothetical protein
MATGDHDRMPIGAIGGQQGDLGQVDRVEKVRVSEFGGERDPEEVEFLDRPVRVDGELRHALGAH